MTSKQKCSETAALVPILESQHSVPGTVHSDLEVRIRGNDEFEKWLCIMKYQWAVSEGKSLWETLRNSRKTILWNLRIIQLSPRANADIHQLLEMPDCLFYLHYLKWRACVYELFSTPSHIGHFSVSHHFLNLPYNLLVSSDSVLIFSSWFPGNHHHYNLCNHHSLYRTKQWHALFHQRKTASQKKCS